MRSIGFKTGDLVRLKLWDDLVDTYGEPDADGDIYIPSEIVDDFVMYFDREMRSFCGTEFRITDIDMENNLVFWLDIYVDDEKLAISLEMIELIPEHELQPYDTDEVDVFLTSIPVIGI